jgi:sarcosine oxidase subunit gamma
MAPVVMRNGVPIDVHERAFAPGDAALTMLDQIWSCIWVGTGSEASYNCLVRRSFSTAFFTWFQDASAEFGGSAAFV